MRNLSWSLLIGLAVGVLTYFLWDEVNEKKIIKTYSTEYELKAEPSPDSSLYFSFSRILQVTEKQLKGMGYEYQLEKTGLNTFRVSVSGMEDTSSLRELLTTEGRLEFRELYNSSELHVMLTKVYQMISQTPAIPVEVKSPQKRDSMSKPVSDLLDSIDAEKKDRAGINAALELIQFNQPNTLASGSITYHAAIGTVKPADTAEVRSMFYNPEIKILGPSDAVFCYGIPEEQYSFRKSHTIPFYFLRTYNTPRALLENADISNSSLGATYDGRPEILLDFTPAGARTWHNMTKRNKGRSLAVTLNGTVIFAPTVTEEIPGGRSSIMGNFTITEAELLSNQIKRPRLPGTVSILSAKTKQEGLGGPGKKLLAALVAFLLFFALSFFILKTLKAS